MKTEKINWGGLTIVVNYYNDDFIAKIEEYPNVRVKADNKEEVIKSIKELFIYMVENKMIT